MPSLQENNYNIDTFKSELTLNRSNFNVLDQRIDKVALAQTIQNIILFNPGTFPNQPELGVGIENYMFELAEDDTLNNLKNRIENQIKTFCNTNYTIDFNLTKKIQNSLSVISIDFNIKSDSEEEEITTFQLLFGKNNEKKMVSKLII